jgi:hypothetical protein
MNRSRYIPRSGDAGTQAALAAAHALGQVADAELIDAFRRHVEAVDEFGGEIYLGGDRRKVANGRVVEHSDPEGSWLTLGYVIGYNHRARFAKAAVEAEIPYEQAEAPELEDVPDEIEPAEAETEAAEELEPEEAAA